ncbi:MAG: DUF2961 domain-containing protein [Phycisphaerae bacterium]|nr:DUF2961 domain-containing protein [Phycisphaerae bacterium]
MRLRDTRTARVSSWNRTGGNGDRITIKPGQTMALADIAGPGCIRHIYCTYILEKQEERLHFFRDVIVRMYWDDEETPSVESPIGDFFGVSNATPRPIKAMDLAVYPGGLGASTSVGLNCYFPMAFSRRARIEVTYDTEASMPGVGIWYHIDYESYPTPPSWMREVGRFHAQFRRQRLEKDTQSGGINKTGARNYVILEARGRGHLAGYMLGVDNIVGDWWGEGDDMIFIDGETWPPSYHGTGTEEIFGGGAAPSDEYSGPYVGFHLVENRDNEQWYGKNAMYRLFARDPVRFRKSIRVTIEHGHANDMANDYSSVAYWYQEEPHAPFPALPTSAERRPITEYATIPSHYPGAIEAERLSAEAKSSGKPLYGLRFGPKWSAGRMLWYRSDELGDFFTLDVPVAESGKYEVVIDLAKSNEFGRFQLFVDGKPLGRPYDAYHGGKGQGVTNLVKAANVSFGVIELAAGTHRFEFRLVGKNEKSTSYMIGVDCIRLRPVR